MKERPINMRAEEVRAILAGRKTQFRRVIKPQSDFVAGYYNPGQIRTAYSGGSFDPTIIPHPFGAPGDRLWVREATWHRFDGVDASTMTGYVADGGPVRSGQNRDAVIDQGPHYKVPSIHMPRKFPRITLEIVSVRIERLKEITHDDAICEGCQPHPDAPHQSMGRDFERLWESINGPGSWDENPWVRAVEFKVIEGGAR